MNLHDGRETPPIDQRGTVDAQSWEDIYRSVKMVFSGAPNGVRVAEVTDLTPGRALDVGCGEGADALWLADHGWEVTAVDLSATGVERAPPTRAVSPGGVFFFSPPTISPGFPRVRRRLSTLPTTTDLTTSRSCLTTPGRCRSTKPAREPLPRPQAPHTHDPEGTTPHGL
jgi:SAM-dependent methyltransferase